MRTFFLRLPPVALPLTLCAAALGLLFAFDAPVSQSSYCPDCGLRQDERQVRFAGYQLPMRTGPREAPSHLSEIFRAAGVTRAHRHRWRPATCPVLLTDLTTSTGQAQLAELSSPRIISFVREIEAYSDAGTIARWHAYLANVSFLRVLEGHLRFLRYPTEGLENRAAFMKWWTENAFALYRNIEITPYICC